MCEMVSVSSEELEKIIQPMGYSMLCIHGTVDKGLIDVTELSNIEIFDLRVGCMDTNGVVVYCPNDVSLNELHPFVRDSFLHVYVN